MKALTFTTIGEIGFLNNLFTIVERWQVPNLKDLLTYRVNCKKKFSDLDIPHPYRKENGLLYPINLARNVARSNTETYFNFPCDIELYPSINIIPGFMKMLQKPDASKTRRKRVYVLPVFETAANAKTPKTKPELFDLIYQKKASMFHSDICRVCHDPPYSWVSI
ncbi:Beta-1,4-glucuronyltransferase 1 [Armadillidium vulgare]|nr:Beta-1,4-glucuronyltransferase 1 [Armadillidium vulgare]